MDDAPSPPEERSVDDSPAPPKERGIYAAALASLPRATPRRLDRLIRKQDPAKVWKKVETGQMARWFSSCAKLNPR